MFLTLNAALDVLFEEGQEKVIERYKENAAIIREGVRSLNLKLLFEEEERMSNTVTSVFLPEDKDINRFLSEMEKAGYVLYLGKGPLLERNMFQIANMGQIFPEDSTLFIKVLERYL